jgi:quercetin dioxygenase-like cupin family protein
MNVKKMIVTFAVFAATGSAFAQPSEFVAPDAAFTSNLTRAEVRQDLAQLASQATLARRSHDGQDTTFVASGRSRQEVRAEVQRSVQSGRAGDVNSLYFGA